MTEYRSITGIHAIIEGRVKKYKFFGPWVWRYVTYVKEVDLSD